MFVRCMLLEVIFGFFFFILALECILQDKRDKRKQKEKTHRMGNRKIEKNVEKKEKTMVREEEEKNISK